MKIVRNTNWQDNKRLEKSVTYAGVICLYNLCVELALKNDIGILLGYSGARFSYIVNQIVRNGALCSTENGLLQTVSRHNVIKKYCQLLSIRWEL